MGSRSSSASPGLWPRSGTPCPPRTRRGDSARSAAGSGMPRAARRPIRSAARADRRTAAHIHGRLVSRSQSQCRRMFRRRSIQVPPEALGLVAPAQLLLGLALDLPDPLSGQPEGFPDLLERSRFLSVEAKTHADDLPLLLIKLVHDTLDLFLERGADQLE